MKNFRCNELAELLFPNVGAPPKTDGRILNAYRIGPSPTGYAHIGTISMAIVNSYLARQSGGIFYLRIEDTDGSRFVADAVSNMKEAFDYFGISFDAGPYIQSERVPLYHAFAKKLVAEGKAYPCFCGEDDLTATRAKQEKNKEKPGYYGKYAKCKSLSFDEVKAKITAGEKWALRADFGAWGENDRITFTDGTKGAVSLPAETNDPIILKSNGVPPYAFAHVVDDTVLNTAAVVRGEEWLISAAQHMQLCDLVGVPRFNYIHMPTLCVEDGGKKRKLSKRKDRMALATNLAADGYTADAVREYLLTVYNTDFELWRIANPNADLKDFVFRVEKIGSNNPMFDLPKLNDIAKTVLAKMTGDEITAAFNAWHKKYGTFKMTAAEKSRTEKMLLVERGGERPRKDLVKFGDIPTLYDYVFDNFESGADKSELLEKYREVYDAKDEKEIWWEKFKKTAETCGYTPDKKAYKESPDKFKGTLSDAAAYLRRAVTGKENSPDMWTICRILGNTIVKNRLSPRSK